MKLFTCQNCAQLVFFENTLCERCGHRLGFIPEQTTLSALIPEGEPLYRALADPRVRYRLCANAVWGACNWLVPETESADRCRACRLNRTIPDLGVDQNLTLWQRLEAAKHRMVYGLLRLGLPVVGRGEDAAAGLAFDFLADTGPRFQETPTVITGHAQGVITINVAEADEVARTRHREDMAEPYRTVLGHFRHEIGHHYWERLVRNSHRLASFRDLFGDERQDYAQALDSHYRFGPPWDWPQRYVSAYASMHPWEDWAESWAHYMHILDTLETAHAFGLSVAPPSIGDPALAADVPFDPYRETDFETLMAPWLPVILATNSLNRAMGQPDLYPFVLAPTVMGKLRFVHGVVCDAGGRA